ncbi:Purine nucleoside phosphorylase [Echinococcus granulosus]|uniref:purine-nucleoside phosphorylase n=1 Tax=Echinococcus granulosus TaxID=6210 RepID=W6UF30_ECHGR|nr:Purine nucleoside phosphorylase [Echinococcus granulosus]EUB60010.1 Purine nucleoside phosphorylase [Echinococcus granulosus]
MQLSDHDISACKSATRGLEEAHNQSTQATAIPREFGDAYGTINLTDWRTVEETTRANKMAVYQQAMCATDYLRSKVHYRPVVGIISGSGLDNITDLVENPRMVRYNDIPGFPDSEGEIEIETNAYLAEILEGVYFHIAGPAHETPATARMLQLLGCDVMGMSLTQEVLVAKNQNMKVFALCLITNKVTTDSNSIDNHNHAAELQVAKTKAPLVGRLIERIILNTSADVKRSLSGRTSASGAYKKKEGVEDVVCSSSHATTVSFYNAAIEGVKGVCPHER